MVMIVFKQTKKTSMEGQYEKMVSYIGSVHVMH